MRFSEYFNLKNHHQKHFDFVNIRLDSDNELFIDPTRIANENNTLFQTCSKIMQDFSNTIFDLYVQNKVKESKNFFRSSSESNEIFLGYTKGFPRGNGNSEESLSKVFDYIHKEELLKEKLVYRVEDFHVFVPDFGADRLSDLVASLIKKELILFTQEQCEIHQIPLTLSLIRPYWDHINHTWKNVEEKVPEYEGKPIVLIPKEITVAKYLYNSNKYWEQQVSEWRQKQNKEQDTLIHRNRPKGKKVASKKDIKKKEKERDNIVEDKEYLIKMTKSKPEMIEAFRNNIQNTQRGTHSNKLSDDQLEDFITNSYTINN